jgi:hypothetical protein
MQQNQTAPSARPAAKLTTESAAALLQVKPATMRRGLCVAGNYLGMVPRKMPNRLLLWDSGEIYRLLAGEGDK